MSWDEYDDEYDDNYDDDLLVLDVLDDMDESDGPDGRRSGGGCLATIFWFAVASMIIGKVLKL